MFCRVFWSPYLSKFARSSCGWRAIRDCVGNRARLGRRTRFPRFSVRRLSATARAAAAAQCLSSAATAIGRVAPAPLGQESVTEGGGSTGHPVVYCVRLCDGQHFPMEHMVNGTPVETCRAICPYSKTKVFFGTEIGDSVAQDGQRYTDLDAAFMYRKQLVANCTCNGRDALGLNKLDVKKDPTLRPGDIVSTKEGLMAYTGKAGAAPGFAPVNPATLPDDIRPGSPQLRLPPASQSTSNDESGTVVPAPDRQSQPGSSTANTQNRSTK